MYVVDSGHNQVFIISNENDASLLGEDSGKENQFSGPSEIAFDNDGNLIIVDSKNHRLQLVDTNQNVYRVKVRALMIIMSIFLTSLYFRSIVH